MGLNPSRALRRERKSVSLLFGKNDRIEKGVAALGALDTLWASP